MSNYIVNKHGRCVECTSAEHARDLIKFHGARAALPAEVEALRTKKTKRQSATRAVAEKRVALDAAAARAAAAAPEEEVVEGEVEEDGEVEEEEAPPVVPREAAEAALRSKNKSEMVSIAAANNITDIKSSSKVEEIREALISKVMSGALALSEVM